MSAQQVGVHSTKRSTFVACVRNHLSAEERLIRRKARLFNMGAQPVTLGEFLGREGPFFLNNRKEGEQRIFSFEDPILPLTRGHIRGEKSLPSGYQLHLSDEGSLEDDQELHLVNFAKIATSLEGYVFSPKLNRSAIAPLLVHSTPAGMMRAVLTCLLATGVLPKALSITPDWEPEGLSCEAFDNIRKMDRGIEETPIQEELQDPTTESSLDPTMAPGITGKGKQRMLQSGHYQLLRESRTPIQEQPPPTAPPRELSPPPPPVTPLSRTRTRKQKNQDTPNTMFPTRVNAKSADMALSQGKHRCPYPTMLQRIAGLFRKPQELLKQKRKIIPCCERYKTLTTEEPGGGVADDNGLLWCAPLCIVLRLTIPRSLVPGILALAHTTYDHPGVARTTELVQRKYLWISLKSDVRDYVLSCGCRRTNISISQRVAILPSRFF